MTIAEKLIRHKQDLDEVYEAGKSQGIQTEYDRFWDTYQEMGNRNAYPNAFQQSWTDETFKPKYNITFGGDYPENAADSMFYKTKIVDLVGCLERQGVSIDFSGCTRLSGTFDRSTTLKTIPPIDAVNIVKMILTFNQSPIESIKIYNLREDCVFDRAFNYLKQLTDLTLTGVIGNTLDIHYSTKLSADSIKSIIEHLGGSASATLTLPTTAEANYDAVYGSGAYATLIATKPDNWTIAYR